MIYLCVVATLSFLVLAGVLALELRGTIKQHKADAERKTDEKVEAEMKRDVMDEGFEAIMAYSIRGNNGFEEDRGSFG